MPLGCFYWRGRVLLRYDRNLFTVKDSADGAKLVLAGEAQYLVTGGGQGVRPIEDPTIALAAEQALAAKEA